MYNDALEKNLIVMTKGLKTQTYYDNSQKFSLLIKNRMFWLCECLETKIYKRIEVFKIVK